MKSNRTVYIYALCDPQTDEVRYVGKTVQLPQLRLEQHIKSATQRSGRHVIKWIRALAHCGQVPKMIILEETDEAHWEQAERKWIAYYRRVQPNLTNHHAGGRITKPYPSRPYRRNKPKKRR